MSRRQERAPRAARALAAVAVALALAGCHSNRSRPTETLGPLGRPTFTESAAPLACPAPPTRTEAAPLAGEVSAVAPPWGIGVTSMQGGEPDADLYVSPPRHEPNGSPRFSDVGVPYPIPDADIDESPPPPPRATLAEAPEVPTTPFVGTSLRPPEGQSGFPETSFGHDAGP
jgi:hypothetical protein